MKSLLTLMILVAAIVAAPVMAEDGNVSDSTLASLGLGSMELLSDADGMSVRGMSVAGAGRGTVVAGWLLFDPDTGGVFSQLGGNQSNASAEDAAAAGAVGTLNPVPATNVFPAVVTTAITAQANFTAFNVVISNLAPSAASSYSATFNAFNGSTQTQFMAQ